MESESKAALQPRRVLIAEDSSITQDLLKLLLSQRGHDVDIVGDGAAALEKLNQRVYDIALLDFHLPKLTGLQVANMFLARCGAGPRPRLVAMTADIEGLLSDANDCEQFDEIIPKPLDIHAVKNLIEADGAVASAPDDAGAGKAPAPDSSRPALSAVIESLDGSFLHWPDDFKDKELAARNLYAEVKEERLDAILLHTPVDAAFFTRVWRTSPLHLLPTVDLTGAPCAGADVNAAELSYGDAEEIRMLIGGFHERRADIHPDFWRADDVGEKLLARIAVKGGALQPVRAPDAREFIRHDAPLDAETLARETQKARASGFLSATFFDRLHACPNCGSSRLNVREECPQCNSPNLSEEPYLHHFPCAYQGREKDFRHGDALLCPKCRKALTHFSVDYDKPGFLSICAACEHAASETNVAFVCVDCGTRAAADAMPTRDVFAYALTDQARAFLDAGRAYLGHAQKALHLADLPLDLVVSLNAEARRYNEDETPFVLLNVGYQNARAIEREHGPRQFARARDLFLENFRNSLNDEAIVVKGRFYDFALIKGRGPEDVEPQLKGFCASAAQALRYDLGVAVQAFGPKDFQ